jgi:hypothetical protein
MDPEEAPYLVDPTSFGLDDPGRNRLVYFKFNKDSAKQIGTVRLSNDEVLPVLRTGDQEGTIYVARNGMFLVYVHYREKHFSMLPGKTITQTALWKKLGAFTSDTFSTELFLNVILEQTGHVLSDKEHTPEGQHFWIRRLSASFIKGYPVHLIDFGRRTVTRMASIDELQENIEKAWAGDVDSKTRAHQIRWLVSKRQSLD